MKTGDTEALGRQRARSKPDTDDRPVRTAHIFVHHYDRTHYATQRQLLFIFLFPQTNITSQMWPSGGNGAGHIRVSSGNYEGSYRPSYTQLCQITVGSGPQ